MKKIFYLVIAVVISVTLCVSAYATDTVETEPYIEVEPVVEETLEEVIPTETEAMPEETEAPEEEYHTIFTRLFEYVEQYKTEVLGVAGDAAILILAFIIKLRQDKKTSTIAKSVLNIEDVTSGTNASQSSVVNVVNDMVDRYNEMKESYDKYGLTEDDRNRVVGALVAQNTAILEMLVTVYSNSKNLPQGAKDLVMLKYANCLKSLEDDEKLKAIVTAVRDNIGASIATEETKTEE